jgi:hypothetical protein
MAWRAGRRIRIRRWAGGRKYLPGLLPEEEARPRVRGLPWDGGPPCGSARYPRNPPTGLSISNCPAGSSSRPSTRCRPPMNRRSFPATETA